VGGDQDAIRGTQTHSEAIRVIEVVPPDAGGNQTPSEALRRTQRRLERETGAWSTSIRRSSRPSRLPSRLRVAPPRALTPPTPPTLPILTLHTLTLLPLTPAPAGCELARQALIAALKTSAGGASPSWSGGSCGWQSGGSGSPFSSSSRLTGSAVQYLMREAIRRDQARSDAIRDALGRNLSARARCTVGKRSAVPPGSAPPSPPATGARICRACAAHRLAGGAPGTQSPRRMKA